MIKNLIHRLLRSAGLDIVRYRPFEFPPDFGPEESGIIREFRHLTATGPERMYALIQAVRYVTSQAIDGEVVECGVWRGGSMAIVARTLLQSGDQDRNVYLFDTFTGMTAPTDRDKIGGESATEVLARTPAWRCEAALEEVRELMLSTGYPQDRLRFVVGRVEETIPHEAPSCISLLRLDTDWYESTRHELLHLFPRLSRGGVLIIDDYGHWDGCRLACDEYFNQTRAKILLNRIDYSGRIGVKL
jgi:hypothetical protein